jgi:hypothetical protein
MITCSKIDDNTFEVTVDASRRTTHRVTVTDDHVRSLSNNNATKEALCEQSFRFLLEREPNTSILSSFDLSTISRYFPEYEREMQKHFA